MGNKQIDVGDVSYPLRCFASIVICDNLNRLRELAGKGKGGSNLLIVSGLETKTTNWKKMPRLVLIAISKFPSKLVALGQRL